MCYSRFFVFFKQKTAYEMRICDWSSDVCSSDLISEEQYSEFYHHVAHAFDQPWMTLHWRAEGRIEYTGLLFIPTARPFDLFRPERRPGVTLYVRRVFLPDHLAEGVPGLPRFLPGVAGLEDRTSVAWGKSG